MDILSQHDKIVFFFSAGKDSLAALLLLKPHWDKFTVVWVNPGAPHPRTVAYMTGIAKQVPHFLEVTGRQPEFIAQYGWPMDVVPMRCTLSGESASGPAPIRMTSVTACCHVNMWTPMANVVRDLGATLTINGQRSAEPMRNRAFDEEIQVIDGITRWQPINSWTDDQVWVYLKEQGAEIPPFYAEGSTSSVDCWNCTAYLEHHQGYLAHMKKNDPERWEIVGPVLKRAAAELTVQSKPIFDVIGWTL
jgi:phosphoadenosine phosphosulfate reductase